MIIRWKNYPNNMQQRKIFSSKTLNWTQTQIELNETNENANITFYGTMLGKYLEFHFHIIKAPENTK